MDNLILQYKEKINDLINTNQILLDKIEQLEKKLKVKNENNTQEEKKENYLSKIDLLERQLKNLREIFDNEILVKNKTNVYLADDKGFNPVDVAGSKDLKYYLGELLAQPYSNPLCRQRIANFLRKRDDKVEEKKIMEKKIEEAKRKEKAEEEELEEENDEEE